MITGSFVAAVGNGPCAASSACSTVASKAMTAMIAIEKRGDQYHVIVQINTR